MTDSPRTLLLLAAPQGAAAGSGTQGTKRWGRRLPYGALVATVTWAIGRHRDSRSSQHP